MAVEIRTTIIPAVATINKVNTFVLDRFFGTPRYFDTAKVQFDIAANAKTTAGFNSFLKKANVVEKDGFNVITLDPLNVNESIVITGRDPKERGFGVPQFGGQPDPQSEAIRQELEDYAKLRERAKRLEVKVAYEEMTTGKIVYGEDGIPEIDFNMPASNIETLSTTWDDASADPIADIIAVYDEMEIQPDTVVMGKQAYQSFIAHSKVRTADDSSGKGMNFQKANAVETGRAGKGVVYAGMLVDRPIEVYVDMQTYKDAGGNTQSYMPPKKVVYGSEGNGELLYGGVTVVNGDSVDMVAVEFLPILATNDNPAMVERIYKSNPLPTMRNANAFYVQTVLS